MQALFPKHNYRLARCGGRGRGRGISLDGSECAGRECGSYSYAGYAGWAGFVGSGLLYLTRYSLIDFEGGPGLSLGLDLGLGLRLGPPLGLIDLRQLGLINVRRLGLDLVGLDLIILLA